MVRWCWVNFQCRGVLLVWIIVGQGPTALAVGAGGGYLDIFLSSIISLLSRKPSERAVKPITSVITVNKLLSVLIKMYK